MPTLIQKFNMCWGKVRRFTLIAFARKSVRNNLERRIGACNRCGACCKIVFKCPAYDDSDGNPRCLAYNDRPGVCSLFPLNESDLHDRDFVMPEQKCGFSFIPKSEFLDGEAKRFRFPWERVYNPRASALLRGPFDVMRKMRSLRRQNGYNHSQKGVPYDPASDNGSSNGSRTKMD